MLPEVPKEVPAEPTDLHPPREKPKVIGTLAMYRMYALQHQPAMQAARNGLCNAQLKIDSVHKIGGIANLVRQDLGIRKEQARFGILAAQAQLSIASWETLYAVTRNYWSAVYAQEQLVLAEEALDPERIGSLRWLRKNMDELYQEASRKDLKEWSITNIDVTIENVRAKKIEAEVGMKRAQAGLREAMGARADFPIDIPSDSRLPSFAVAIDRGRSIHDALHRRGEITAVMVFREVADREVIAQGKTHSWTLQNETFASGADIHVISVPMQLANGEYRPGAIGLEMPGKLAGSREDRVHQASLLAERAEIVVEKTRQLMTLQADDAYWKFEKAQREVVAYGKVLKQADLTKDKIADDFRPVAPLGARPNLDDLLGAGLRSAQFKLSLNQARYERLLALTLLERVTSGGVSPGFDTPYPAEESKPTEGPK